MHLHNVRDASALRLDIIYLYKACPSVSLFVCSTKNSRTKRSSDMKISQSVLIRISRSAQLFSAHNLLSIPMEILSFDILTFKPVCKSSGNEIIGRASQKHIR